MKTFKTIYSLLLAIGCVTVSLCGTANAQWPGDFHSRGGFYLEATGKAYQRPGDDLGIGLVFDAITNETLLTTGGITDMQGGTGGEVRFGFPDRLDRNWELRTNFATWNHSRTIESPNGNQLTSPLIIGIDPDQISFDYDSDIFSIELSHRHCVQPGVVLFAGPRFVSVKEDFTVRTRTEIPTPAGPFLFETDNLFSTRNAMIGGQIGMELNIPVNRAIYVSSFIRAGGYGNPVRSSTRALTTITTPTTTTNYKTTGTFIGETGGKIHFQVIPDVVGGFVGYEATWIDGIALAPVQAFSTGQTGVITSTTPFFHAVIFGVHMDY